MRKNRTAKRLGNAGGRTTLRNERDNLLSHPPAIDNCQLTHGVTLRYLTTEDLQDQSITYQALLNTMVQAATATLGSSLFKAVKIRRVKVWSSGVTSGSVNTIAVEFRGQGTDISGDRKLHSDTSMGIQPAHLNVRPQKESYNDFFQISSNQTAFVLTCPVNSVIDVDLTFRSEFGAVNNSVVLVAAVPSVLYFRGLDDLPVASTKLKPAMCPLADIR